MGLLLYLTIGLIIGPTLLDLTLPSSIETLPNLAGAGFLFVAGLELSAKETSRHLKQAFSLTPGALLFPFMIGVGTSQYLLPLSSAFPSQNLFVGLAFSVSALPVVIQVLKDVRLYGTPTGHLIVSTATISDLVVWLVFLFMLPSQYSGNWLKSHFPIILFFVGLVLSDFFSKKHQFTKQLMRLNYFIFAPIFFIAIGLKINLRVSFDFSETMLLVVLAALAKIAGGFIFARLNRIPHKESLIVAFALNARGAMEILLCMIGLQAGMIQEQLFTSLVAMAIITSLMATPLIRLVNARR